MAGQSVKHGLWGEMSRNERRVIRLCKKYIICLELWRKDTARSLDYGICSRAAHCA